MKWQENDVGEKLTSVERESRSAQTQSFFGLNLIGQQSKMSVLLTVSLIKVSHIFKYTIKIP